MNETKRSGRKRGDGEGSIRQRSDGMWRGEIMVGHRPDGKPDRRYVYAKTRKDCQRKLDELKQRARVGLLGDASAGREALGAFLVRWIEAIDGTIRPSSHYRYRVNVEKHLAPTIGRHKLADLRPEHLVGLYAAKRKEGLAPRTVKYMHTTIRKALTMAVEWGAVPRNVATVVGPPKVPRVEIKPPSTAEVARLLETARACGDRLAPLWAIMVYSGCREGELLGLRWDDLNLDASTITIRRTLASVEAGVPKFEEPKTPSAARTFKLPPTAVEAFRIQRDRQNFERQRLGEGYTDYGLVFASGTGRPLHPTSVPHQFKVALERAGLSRTYTPHGLRHANASAMHAKGTPLRVMSERLGHSTPAITLSIYSHMVGGQDAEAADKIEDAFREAT